MTEKEAYEAGYRAACMANGIPYVGVRHTQDRMLRVEVVCTLLDFLQVKNYNEIVAERVTMALDKWREESGIELHKNNDMENENTKCVTAVKPVCHHCGKDLEPYNPNCPHCGKMRAGYGKAAEKKKGWR